jgi:hypothetical protein
MNITKRLQAFFDSGKPTALIFSVVLSVLLVTGLVQAASTISTNITTDGNITAGGTLGVAGVGTLGLASTTVLSVNNTAYFGATATTTINGAGNLFVVGSTTLQNFTFQNATSTHSNTATSTLVIGCIQMYATSTATAVRLEFGVNNMASTTFSNATANGQVVWRYGTCPKTVE